MGRCPSRCSFSVCSWCHVGTAFLDMADIELNSFVVNDDDLGDGAEGSDLGSLSDGDNKRCPAL